MFHLILFLKLLYLKFLRPDQSECAIHFEDKRLRGQVTGQKHLGTLVFPSGV